MQTDININRFECGCVWTWEKAQGFTTVCSDHKGRPAECRCLNSGQDDGAQTCWNHHDCSRGDCTHQDGDDDHGDQESEDFDD